MAEETISAVITALGEGAVGIVRISGEQALAVGETLFGGVSYSHSLGTIPAGGSVRFQADECYLGEVSVARVSRGG